MNVTEANKKLRTIAAVNSAVLTDTNAATKGNKKPSTVQGIAELSHQQQQQQQHTKKGKDNNTNTAPVPGQQQDQMNVTPYPNAGAAPGGAPGGAYSLRASSSHAKGEGSSGEGSGASGGVPSKFQTDEKSLNLMVKH